MKKIMNWLNGKKTALAALYWTIVVPTMPVIYPSGAPDDVQKTVNILGIVLTAIGLGHKAVKAKKR